MYRDFYALQEKPFDLMPDPDFFYLSSGHDHAYTHLQYAIHENKGFVVISGEIGCGKTTLINYFLRQLPNDLLVGVINHTDVEPELFIKLICRKFELDYSGLDKAEMVAMFQDFLVFSRGNGQRVTLIIDEAQNLPDNTLEEIRMLSNLEAEKEPLLQIILVGQPELRQKLRQEHLEQFVQRISVHYHLERLGEAEVTEYIRHRLHVAGCPGYATLFTPAACTAVFQASRGVPRIINYICDMALVHGYADGLTQIDEKIIENVLASRRDSPLFKEDSTSCGLAAAEAGKKEPSSPKQVQAGHLNFLEETISSLNLQLENSQRALHLKDRLLLELSALLRESFQDRRTLSQNYVTIYQRYRKMLHKKD
ncbi:MAG: AAA family ATPase [Deltaproteobacteria bacterium]|nr:AAA family ATPase [Deltaproteobacteria bacterium]